MWRALPEPMASSTLVTIRGFRIRRRSSPARCAGASTSLGINGSKAYNVGLPAPLNVAAGVLFRGEDYAIKAGELASYVNGGHSRRTRLRRIRAARRRRDRRASAASGHRTRVTTAGTTLNVSRSRNESDAAVPRERRGTIRALQRLRLERLREARAALSTGEAVRDSRIVEQRLPRAGAVAELFQPHHDELHWRPAVRDRELPCGRARRADLRCQAAQGGEVGQHLERHRVHAGRELHAHTRLLPHQDHRPHPARRHLRGHCGAGHPRRFRHHGDRGRAVLHEWIGHEDGRH